MKFLQKDAFSTPRLKVSTALPIAVKSAYKLPVTCMQLLIKATRSIKKIANQFHNETVYFHLIKSNN